MDNLFWTNEKKCVNYCQEEFYRDHQARMIFKKGRKYFCVQGDLFQESDDTFKNVFGETRHYLEDSDIRRKYENDGYELRGFINSRGCFKNN